MDAKALQVLAGVGVLPFDSSLIAVMVICEHDVNIAVSVLCQSVTQTT